MKKKLNNKRNMTYILIEVMNSSLSRKHHTKKKKKSIKTQTKKPSARSHSNHLLP